MWSPARLLSLLAALLFLVQVPLAHMGMEAVGMAAGETKEMQGQLLHVESEACHAHSGPRQPHDTHSHHDCSCCAPPAVDLSCEARLLAPAFGLATAPPEQRVHARQRASPARARDPPFLLTA